MWLIVILVSSVFVLSMILCVSVRHNRQSKVEQILLNSESLSTPTANPLYDTIPESVKNGFFIRNRQPPSPPPRNARSASMPPSLHYELAVSSDPLYTLASPYDSRTTCCDDNTSLQSVTTVIETDEGCVEQTQI